MSKARTKYVCQQCGHESPGFYGRCPECNAWGSMVETLTTPSRRGSSRSTSTETISLPRRLSDVPSADVARRETPMQEFSRVLGGGAVPGALVLVGGDPGIGKSTLLLQSASGFANGGHPVLYVTGEESAQQVRLRADRLGVGDGDLYILSETRLESILQQAETLNPAVLIVDSIQTVYLDELNSAPGSVSQVRDCTARLMAYAKPRDVTVFLVGHVTKEGALAGPRVLEHMVDAVLYLEGERFQQYRILRAVKNRFGSTDEVGVFEMVETGMREVHNPSEAFLQERSQNAAGSTVIVTIEGTRPILVEVQGLTTPAAYGNARRSPNGFDINRLQMLAAVLSKRVGMSLSDQDIYVNVVGGLNAVEPAADLGIALAIASSYREQRVDNRMAVVGEVGLSGELRSVSQTERRIGEARKLGFDRVLIPATLGRGMVRPPDGIEVIRAATLAEAIDRALDGSPSGKA